MNNSNLPPNIKLLKIISEELLTLTDLFNISHKEFEQFKNDLIGVNDFFINSKIIDNNQYIKYFQLLLLLDFAERMPSLIKQCGLKNNEIRLVLDKGLLFYLNLGEYNEKTKKFFSYYCSSILKFSFNQGFNHEVLKNLYLSLTEQQNSLNSINLQINYLIKFPEELNKRITNNFPLSYLILSALPEEQINAFFINFASNLQQDIELAIDNQQKINLKSYFQTSSQDITFLNQKLQMLFSLRSNEEAAEIFKVYQQQGVDLLVSFLANNNVRAATFNNLKAFQEQIIIRLFLLIIFNNHLRLIIN